MSRNNVGPVLLRRPFHVASECGLLHGNGRVSTPAGKALMWTAPQQLLAIFEHAVPGLAILDLDGKVVECNKAFAAVLGKTQEQLQGADLHSMTHKDDHEPWEKAVGRLLSGQVPAFVLEMRYINGDGEEVYACDSVSPFFDDQRRPQGIVVIAEDITPRKRAEKALQQTEGLVTMGRLSASIAHELNNPLESVTNLLFLISHSAELEDVHRYSRLAEQELARVTRIATQTLRFYRPQAAPAPVQLQDVMDSVLALFEGRLRREQVRVTRTYLPGAPALTAYSSELRQVFVNLVGNALDAMSEQGSLRLSVRPSHSWGQFPAQGIRVTVSDTGCGIPRKMLRKVFEPFVTTKETSGTGLGLWISQDIVRRHGGTLRVRSAVSGPGRGTCMSVFLPAPAAEADAHAAA